jgi:hypothetical protein
VLPNVSFPPKAGSAFGEGKLVVIGRCARKAAEGLMSALGRKKTLLTSEPE